MNKTPIELTMERMKARAFIREYYAENGVLPTSAQVKTARVLNADEIAEVTAMEERAALIAESEDREPSALVFGAPKVGVNIPMLGEITGGEVNLPVVS